MFWRGVVVAGALASLGACWASGPVFSESDLAAPQLAAGDYLRLQPRPASSSARCIRTVRGVCFVSGTEPLASLALQPGSRLGDLTLRSSRGREELHYVGMVDLAGPLELGSIRPSDGRRRHYALVQVNAGAVLVWEINCAERSAAERIAIQGGALVDFEDPEAVGLCYFATKSSLMTAAQAYAEHVEAQASAPDMIYVHLNTLR